MRLIALVATLASLHLGHATAPLSSLYHYRMLGNPTSGDEFGFRGAMQQYAQGRSDRMFGALAQLLGGTSPQLNFVTNDSPLTENHLSANVADAPGAPKGTINLDPLATEALIDDTSPNHSPVVNGMPHEMAHTRQTPQTLADLLTREGGAQAFADLQTPQAAAAARIPYTPGDYDGAYTDLVKQITATRPQSWILQGQFGR